MESIKSDFALNGLKIDQERVLPFSGIRCPLGCRYCFADDVEIQQNGTKDFLTEKQISLLGELPDDVSLIMLGCDTEFFQDKQRALDLIRRVAEYPKDIALITKLNLPIKYLENLKSIEVGLAQRGNIMVLSSSLPCLGSSSRWEPDAPPPERRIEMLKNANELGLKTMVGIRPLLPDISDSELVRLVDLTQNYTQAYFSGPLYLKNMDILNHMDQDALTITQSEPHWMPDGNSFYKIHRNGQEEYLKNILLQRGFTLFEGAADGIKFLKEYEKHRD